MRATYESGLISAEAFVKNWNLLKDFSVEMRSGNGKSTLKNKTIIAIHAAYQKELTLFERLYILAEVLNVALTMDDLGVSRSSNASRNSNASRDSSTSHENTELSAGTLREYFRPYLKARYLKDHELKNARELLGKIDRTPTDDPEFAELYLQAKAMLEDFEILKYKRKGNDAEDIVEEDALARLKGRFGRL